MSLVDLPVAELEGVIERFHPQTTLDNCYPAGLMNIINELGRRKGITGMRYSLSTMDHICGYKASEHCPDELVPARVNRELEQFEYELKIPEDEDSDIESLKMITEDDSTSFPLVNVHASYFELINLRWRGAHTLDHVLVIMGVDHDIIYFYDPYTPFFSKYPSIKEPPRNISIPDFLRVWELAHDRRWMCWVGPMKTRQSRLMEDK
jgi:hypothetical protein